MRLIEPFHELFIGDLPLPRWIARRRGELAIYILILAVAAFAWMLIHDEKQASLSNARSQFVKEQKLQDAADAERINDVFRRIHRGLRTLARLPGIRNVDRYAVNLSSDAKASAQEIYNNLAESVAISEVYIVPVTFNPDVIDPITGRLEEPITTFDDLIVGRTAESETSGSTATHLHRHSASTVEELEIHEYRLMKHQIGVFKERHPTEQSVRYSNYPAIAGEEVITCDNTRFSPADPNDRHRMGLVYSVPFYDLQGQLKGIVSAVLLTEALRKLMPNGRNAVVNTTHNYTAGSIKRGTWSEYHEYARAALPSPDLIHSAVSKLEIADLAGHWQLWSGTPDSAFWNSLDVKAANEKAFGRYIAMIVATCLLMFLVRYAAVHQRSLKDRANELQRLVQKRTMALAKAKEDAEQASRAKSRFLANVSHEIRTPLGAIVGTTDVMVSEGIRQQQEEHLAVIQGASRSLLNLVGQVLDMSVIESGKLTLRDEPADIYRLVQDVVQNFKVQAQEKRLNIITDISPEVPRSILIDPIRFSQILLNLVGNAVKFTARGAVRICIDATTDAHESDKYKLTISVHDTGIGINSCSRSKIFEAFRQANEGISLEYGGTGLGLSISQNLVKVMGGSLEVDTQPGVGSCFYFSIEVKGTVGTQREACDTEVRENQSLATGRSSLRGLKILVAEDNPVLSRLTRKILENQGCSISVASTGTQAVELAVSRSFDMILMDCRLPELDGNLATANIRAAERKNRTSRVPILAMTANAFDQDRRISAEAGMNDLISKPFTANQLISAVRKNIDERSGHQPR